MKNFLLSYIAGLYEGEGTVWYHDGHIAVRMAMTDKEPLQKVMSSGIGKISGPRIPKNPRWKPLWRWELTGWDNVESFYLKLKPWLSPRRIAQFEVCLRQERATPRKKLIPSPPCGYDRNTPSATGRLRHIKKGENPCEDCHHASLLYMRLWRARKTTTPIKRVPRKKV